MAMELSDERIRRDMGDLTTDVVRLFEAKYPRLYNTFSGFAEDQLIELMIELCDIFDLYRELTAVVSKQYQEHRTRTGSLEDRDWPEN